VTGRKGEEGGRNEREGQQEYAKACRNSKSAHMTPYTLPTKSQLPAIRLDRPSTTAWWPTKAAVASAAVRAIAARLGAGALARADRNIKGGSRRTG